MAHTPGPWKISLTDDTVVIDATGAEVAAIDGDYNDPDTWPQMEANARLIAAAPDMLAVLRVIETGSFPGAHQFALNGDWHGFATALQKFAGAAIAKAIAL